MSTTAEYFVRNMSTTEFERFFGRLQSREREATLGTLRGEMDKALSKALTADREARAGELRAVRDGVESVRAQMEARASCNERQIASFTARLEDFRRQGQEQYNRALQAVKLLRREADTLRCHLDTTRARVDAVEQRAAALEQSAVEERARREAEARRLAGHAEGLRTAAESRLATAPAAECRRLGLEAERTRVVVALDEAVTHIRAGAREAAAATLGTAHRTAVELVEQLAARRDEERAAMAGIELALVTTEARLAELATEDVRRFLGAELDRHTIEARTLRTILDSGPQPWPKGRAVLEDARARAAALANETGMLHARYEELLEQATAREAVLRSLVEALVEIWGSEFEMDVDYVVRSDARSPISFRTKRGPYAPNVRAILSLDGRLEVSFTGYRGTECVSDLDAVKSAIRRGGAVALADGSRSVEPDKPNPPDVGPANLNPGPISRDTASSTPNVRRKR